MKKTITIAVLCMIIVALSTIITSQKFHKEEYYCEDEDLTMKCAKMSVTNMTCYPHNCDNKEKNYCSTGWLPINELS